MGRVIDSRGRGLSYVRYAAAARNTQGMSGHAFWSASVTISGIEIMHMIRKGQPVPSA